MKAFLYCTDGTVKETNIQSIEAQTFSLAFSGKEVDLIDVADAQNYTFTEGRWTRKT